MAGLIVVRGPIDEVPEIAAAREIFLVAQSINGNLDPTKKFYELEYKAYHSPLHGGYKLDADYTMFTVNGEGVCWYDVVKDSYEQLPTPQFEAQPGEVLRIRFLNGTNHNPLPLILAGFDVWMIGFDGINTLEPIHADVSGKDTPELTPANLQTAPVRMTVPGNRIEMLIRAPQQAGTYALSSLKTKGVNATDAPTIELARFVVSGAPMKMGIPKKLPIPTREYPIIGPGKPKRQFTFSVGQDKSILTGLGFFVNKELYDHEKVPTVVRLGDEEEWRIENEGGSVHPFHVHVNSFQLTAIDDVPNDPPQIWDTFYVPPKVGGKNGSITFRIRFVQFRGKSVHHCHVLPHEDTGMMQNFTIE
jgi:FtsP/CotA-like multicopper oxidase with cupredoxin domain